MTWADKYYKSVRIASHFNSRFAKDIAHDAWIAYLERTGCDLFEVPVNHFESYCARVIRNSFYKWYRNEHTGGKYIYFTTDELQSGLASPEDILFGQDLYQILLNRIRDCEYEKPNHSNPERLETIFRLSAQGYEQSAIAKKLEVSKTVVAYYNKKIKMINNPLNGNKVQIKKSIGLYQWEKRTDHEDYVLEDYNEFYRLYQHKESKEGLLVKLPAEKRNAYIK